VRSLRIAWVGLLTLRSVRSLRIAWVGSLALRLECSQRIAWALGNGSFPFLGGGPFWVSYLFGSFGLFAFLKSFSSLAHLRV